MHTTTTTDSRPSSSPAAIIRAARYFGEAGERWLHENVLDLLAQHPRSLRLRLIAAFVFRANGGAS